MSFMSIDEYKKHNEEKDVLRNFETVEGKIDYVKNELSKAKIEYKQNHSLENRNRLIKMKKWLTWLEIKAGKREIL